MNEPMRAITINQPFASLLAVGAMKYYTRSLATSYRGPIVIHSEKVDNYKGIGSICEILKRANEALESSLPGFTCIRDLPHGKIIATAELVGCWECIGPDRRGDLMLHNGRDGIEADNRYIGDDELLFGDFSRGRYAWEFTNVQMFHVPIPARGKPGVWIWRGNND